MQLKTKIFVRQKLKHWFIKLKLHRLFSSFLLDLAYLNRLSRWCANFDGQVLNLNRYDLYRSVVDLNKPVDYLEFGVGSGSSFLWWVENNKNPKSKFFGFDSFEGLPKDFGPIRKGYFSTGGKPPQINDKRHKFFVGVFQETLFDFITSYRPNNPKIIHLDADLYSSTLFVLILLAPYLKLGDILIFDEFGVPMHEFRAFTDFLSVFPVRLKPLIATSRYQQVVFRVE